MTALLRRLWRLFVDSAWLAAAALQCVAVCAASVQAGAPRVLAAGLLLAGLGLALAVNIRSVTKPA